MTLVILAAVLALLGVASAVAVKAFHSKHLVAFRHDGHHFYHRPSLFLLERMDDGRYQVVPLSLAPLALARFAWTRVVSALGIDPGSVLQNLPRHSRREERRARAAHA